MLNCFMLLFVQVSGTLSKQQGITSSVRNIIGSGALKQNQQRQGSGRIVKRILLNKDSRQNQSFVGQSEHQVQTSNLEKDKRPPRPSHGQLVSKDTNPAPDDKVVGNDLHGFCSEKQEKRSRNKDKPDRGIWTSLRRSDGSHASDESLSSSASQPILSLEDSTEGATIFNM
jgi:regulator of nonsense transcripts 3